MRAAIMAVFACLYFGMKSAQTAARIRADRVPHVMHLNCEYVNRPIGPNQRGLRRDPQNASLSLHRLTPTVHAV
jgi:hypothetical protein